MDTPIPPVEIPHHARAHRPCRPHRKMLPLYSIHGLYMRAQLIVRVVMPSLAHQVQIKFAQQERKRIRIMSHILIPIFRSGLHPVAPRGRCKFAHARQSRLKQSLILDLFRGNPFATVAQNHASSLRARPEKSHHPPPPLWHLHRVRPQHRKRVRTSRRQKCLHPCLKRRIFRVCRKLCRRLFHASILTKSPPPTNPFHTLTSCILERPHLTLSGSYFSPLRPD